MYKVTKNPANEDIIREEKFICFTAYQAYARDLFSKRLNTPSISN